MADEVSPEVIQNTQKLLGKHVIKPPLTEKLLRKPPFRFLHDIISGLVRERGFLKGLFTDKELISDNVKEREAKIAFLTKLITAVKSISGKDLQARPNKIIAGLEPAETNKLLQTIGNCLSDKIDTKEYVKSLKKSSKDTKDSSNLKRVPSKKSTEKPDSTRSNDVKKSEKLRKNNVDTVPKGKTSNKTNVEKPSITGKEKLSKNTKSNVKKSPRDGSSGSTPKSPNRKLANDIVEPPENKTNDDIQQDNKTVESKPEEVPAEEQTEVTDSWKPQIMDEAYMVINQSEERQDTLPQPEVEATLEKTKPESNETAIRQPSARPKSARPRSSLQALNHVTSQKSNMPLIKDHERTTEKLQAKIVTDLSRKPSTQEEITQVGSDEELKVSPTSRPRSSLLRPPSVRPSSARPGAPRLRPDSSMPMKELIPFGKINVIVEDCDPKASNSTEDEDETVVVATVSEDIVNHEPQTLEKSLDIPVDKGHLVEQILEQIQGQDGNASDDRIDWDTESLKSNDATTKEIDALRASIQALTSTANPLGKLTSYLHEDIETMQKELEMWTNMRNQTMQEIGKQQRANSESNQPLLAQLQMLDENIKKERSEIAAIKYNLIRNDERIRQLVNKQITIE